MANGSELNETEIVRDIEKFIEKHGGDISEWYVGVSNDAKSRLFEDHKVRKDEDAWIVKKAVSSRAARDAEGDLLVEGAKGGAGGGDSTATMVYAYKKAAHTIQ